MLEPQIIPFSTRGQFEALVLQCLERAHLRLQLFDPDFSSWPFNSATAIAHLRKFLLSNKKGKLEIVMHKTGHLERACPRFMRLLADFPTMIECRVTQKNLAQLTDSFCIADALHIVRRFHADHFRGEAAFDSPPSTQLSADRFADIWLASEPGLHANILGL